MSEQVTVSIIVPVYNAVKCIEDTILSIKSQTFTDWELILVDDCSQDGSMGVMERYVCDNIHMVQLEQGSGAAAARNKGIELAKGRYISFIDADDLWSPEKLEHQIAFMEEQECAFCFTGYEFADENGVGVQKIVRVPNKLHYRAALKNTTIFTSTVMFDMTKISKELIQMPEVESEDTATWWKILRNGYVAYGLDEALTLYRRTMGSLSSNKVIAIKRIWNLYRNMEGLSVLKSAYCFCFYAVRAVIRRL
jgi:teichuronic acid biosynthesis glycosyltransferase TuaG